MKINELSRFPLAHLPTPLEELQKLPKMLGGPRLFIKRDDQTGLAMGGNKTRKLEFVIGDALRQKADTIVTTGAAQSNHCRQTAAACVMAGLPCELILSGEKPKHPNGNLLLDYLLGAKVHWTEKENRDKRMEEVADALRSEGRKPYAVPLGASNAVGATGYVIAMMELAQQLKDMKLSLDRIVVASSSGGTQAGLEVGAKAVHFKGQIIGIRIDKGSQGDDPYDVLLARLSNETAARVGLEHRFSNEDFTLYYDYLGEGYGIVGDLEREAIHLMARSEGILLDPVYTGRAFGALVDLVKRKVFSSSETVLFWHTGGPPALFAYGKDLGY